MTQPPISTTTGRKSNTRRPLSTSACHKPTVAATAAMATPLSNHGGLLAGQPSASHASETTPKPKIRNPIAELNAGSVALPNVPMVDANPNAAMIAPISPRNGAPRVNRTFGGSRNPAEASVKQTDVSG